MINPLKIAVLLLALVAAGPLAAPGGGPPVPVAVDNAYPPYMFGTNPAQGLYPEIIRAAFKAENLPVNVAGYPWKRALRLGQERKAAVGGIYQNLKRLQAFDYSDPLFTETLVVCVRKGQGFPFRGLVDLSGKRVGINRGWSYGEVFDSARRAALFTAEEAADNAANLKKLLAGRVDCTIVDVLSLRQILKRMAWHDKIESLEVPAAINSAHLVFAKQAHQRHVLETFNRGLVKIKANGTYRRIIDRFALPGETN